MKVIGFCGKSQSVESAGDYSVFGRRVREYICIGAGYRLAWASVYSIL